MQDAGYMSQVMRTLKEGEYRQFDLVRENVFSWRTVASRMNREAGYRKYSVTINSKLGIMAVKHNAYE